MNVFASHRLLIIDDDRELLELLIRHCARQGFDARGVSSLRDLGQQMTQFRPDAVLCDLAIDPDDAVQCLELLRDIGFAGPVFLMSGCESRVLRATFQIGGQLGLNMAESIAKPFDLAELTGCLRLHLKAELPLNEQALRAGIEQRQVIAHFQPQVDLASGRLLGAEALARWAHPNLGLVPPLRFIGMAEKSGLIAPMTLHILADAVRLIETWQSSLPDIRVSVNVTAPLLTDQGFVGEALRLIEAPKVRRAIKLEITESSAMDNSLEIEAALARLRIRGISLSLDDFGTGYSSLVALHRMPFTELKVDQSFVKELDRDGDAKVIVRALIDLAHNLGQKVCAEGVETAPALSFLRSLGCDAAQGFHIAKPLAPEDFDDWCGQILSRDDGSAFAFNEERRQAEAARSH